MADKKKKRKDPPDAFTGYATRPFNQLKKAAKVTTSLSTRPFNQLRKGASFAKRVGMEVMHMPTEKQKKEAAELRKKRDERKAKRESLKNKNQPPANPPANKTKKTKTPTKKTETPTKKSDALKVEKAAWLKKTRNSPAAKSGAFTDDERWAQQQKHRAWKASRKKKKR